MPEDRVPPGWQHLVAPLRLAATAANLTLGPVREKYGELRVDYTGENPAFQALVNEAEILSRHTCMDCGGQGLQYRYSDWYAVRCPACALIQFTDRQEADLRETRAALHTLREIDAVRRARIAAVIDHLTDALNCRAHPEVQRSDVLRWRDALIKAKELA